MDLWRAIEDFCIEQNRERASGEFSRLTPALESVVTDRDGAFGTAQLRMGFRLSPDDNPSALPQVLTAALELALELS